jgi:tetratricopeptide (TPR) repeat protein/transcriptional regulator with XRE-family HTH domain
MTKDRKPNRALRHERETRGWSQQYLAEKLRTTDKLVSDWERGVKTPGKEHQRCMCELFGKTAEDLGFLLKKERTVNTNLVLVNPSSTTEQKVVLSAATVFWLVTTHPSAVQALIQQLQNEPQSSHTPSVVESAPDLVDTSPQKEEASPSPDVHIEGTMEDDQDSGGEGMNEGRRKTTRGIVLLGTTALTGHRDFIADVQRVLRQPSSGPGDKELKYLEQKIGYYWDDHYNVRIAPDDLMLHVAAYVQEVKTLLDRSLLPSTRTRLCTCLSMGMLLIGVSFHNLGQFQAARECFQTALESAHEANHHILQALAWRYTSYSWIRSKETNRYEHALDTMLQASYYASLESDLTVQSFIQAGLAEVYALNNEKEACLKALKCAVELAGYGPGDWYFIHRFNLARLNGYRGLCLQQLYRPDDPDTHPLLEEARQVLKEALSLPNVVALQRAFCIVDMAQIHAREGEVESACEYVKQIISIADTSAPLRQRLVIVRIHLKPYADVASMRDLDIQMRALQLH